MKIPNRSACAASPFLKKNQIAMDATMERNPAMKQALLSWVEVDAVMKCLSREHAAEVTSVRSCMNEGCRSASLHMLRHEPHLQFAGADHI